MSKPHERAYFSRTEAHALVGVPIRTTVAFSGVPAGTTGTVVRADKDHREGWTVAIAWDLPGRGKPLVDWFSKDEFDRWIEQTERRQENVGKRQRNEQLVKALRDAFKSDQESEEEWKQRKARIYTKIEERLRNRKQEESDAS